MGTRRFFSYGTWLAGLLLMTGCSLNGRILNLSGDSAFQISGSVLGVTVNSLTVHSLSCSPTVTLYGLNADGSKQNTAIASATLNNDGTFLFDGLQETSFDPNFSKTQYIIDADPCTGDLLSRLVTAKTAQDISYSSTLLSFVPDVKHVTKTSFSQIEKSSIDSIEAVLNNSSAGDIQSSYQAGLNDAALTADFQSVFGFAFSELQYSLPDISSVTHVNSVNELQAAAMSVSASHWDPNVTLAYIWKVDGVVKSIAKNFNWTPGKNDQGSYDIDLYVGIDTGSGLDISKSYVHSLYHLTVADNFPATAPILSLTSSSVTSSQLTTLSLATGAALSNCQSFSKLVFTESSSSAALTLPSSADFTSGNEFACTTSTTQAANFTVSSGDGNHTIALWAEDAAGNISQVSDFVNMTLDQTPPVVGALTVPSILAGGGTAPIAFSASDATSGLASLILYYAADGVTFSQVADLTAGASPFSWAVPSDNTTTAKLRVIAIDNVGNSTTVDSNTFTVDSTAPSALSLAFTTPADFGTTSASLLLSKTAANSVSVTGCSGDATKMFFKEVDTTEGTAPTAPTAPLATDVGWVSCATASTWTAVTGDGEKTYYAWAIDTAGNVSAVSNALTFVLDQSSPTLTLTSFNSASVSIAGGTSHAITWTSSDAHFSATPIQLEYTLDGATWVTITAATANTGSYSWTAPSVDGGGNPIDLATANVRISASDLAANPTTAVTGTAFSIRSSPPVLSSVLINGGAQYAGTTLANLKVALSDHGFATTGIKVTLNQAVNSAADCTLPTTPVWIPWINASTNIPYQLSAVGGLKKICVWAKNQAGFISASSPFTCTIGTDCNTIELQTGSPPKITTLSASSGGGYAAPIGSDIAIDWAASAQGSLKLDNNPIAFAYTVDNVTWYDITSGKDVSTATDATESNPATAVMTWVGGLSGNPVSASGTVHFPSPSNSFARLRAVARDIAGNYSIVAYSNVFNTTIASKGTWQIYAGSRNNGNGGSGTSASLNASYGQPLAIDPLTGDIYARDTATGIRKLDVKTGLVSTYIANSATNTLSTNGGPIAPAGVMPSALVAGDSTYLTFSRDGFLYISLQLNNGIYKINVRNNTSILYLGGGTLHDSTNNPLSIYVRGATPISLDEDNTMYFFTDCLSDTAPNPNHSAPRLMKAVQNSDGTAGAVTTLAGNCAYGSASASGTLATAATLGPASAAASYYTSLATIVAINHGQTIYFGNGSAGNNSPFKIVNNGTDTRLYRATPVINSYGNNMNYNPIDGKIYFTSSDFGVSSFTPVSAAADGGEVVTSVVSGAGTADTCMDNGIDAASTCVFSDARMDFDSSGTLYFIDGIGKNSGGGYRIRYLDSTNKVSSIFGSLPFYGDGLKKELIRGPLAGIYYKKSSENNLTAFPSGLYLTSPSMVFGYIDPATGIYSTLLGKQLNGNVSISALIGQTISPHMSLGTIYSGGNGYPLTFDSNGLPWMRAQNAIVTIDSNKQIQSPDVGNTGTFWDRAADGAPANTMSLYVSGGYQNFSLMGNSLFLMGGYYAPPSYTGTTPQIRLLDFTNNVSPIIMGKGYTVEQGLTTPTSVAAGDGTTTPVQTSPLSSSCTNNSCKLQYQGGVLYFSDGTNQIHYITHPEDPTLSTLGTLGLTTVNPISSFVVKDDGSQIFVVAGGPFYCYPLTPAGVKTWCPSSGLVNLYNYSAQIGSLSSMPNMYTWMDANNLLISTGVQILQYTLPTVP